MTNDAYQSSTDTDAGSSLSSFDQVKAKVSLEAYFGEHLKRDLRMEGTGLMACRCPWHEEKTPSLKIYIDEGYFKCFGACDFGGSIIDAVMKTENFDWPLEAVEWINDHYKLGITNISGSHKQFKERTDRAQKKFSAAQSEMDDPKSAIAIKARAIIEERGITEETWRHFGLSVDKERARILIPIFEKGGHPSAWSGRAMMETMPCPNCKEIVDARDVFNQRSEAHSLGDHEGRYPGSCQHPECKKAAQTCPHCKQATLPLYLAGQFPKYSDSPGYQKSETLYNLPAARKGLREQKEFKDKQPLLAAEGFGDVWACHQAGFVGAMAYNGSAMTLKQAGQFGDLAKQLDRWIGLVPDFDSTGRSKVHKNIEFLRKVNPAMDIRVLHGIDKYTYEKNGKTVACKDAGEMLQHHGDEVLYEVLTKNWWTADEFKIREVLEGDWDKLQQIERVTGVLSEAQHTIALDEIVPILAEHWSANENTVRVFLHNSNSRGAQLMDSANLISTITDAHRAAEKYLEESFVISTDYETINECLPGGGFRLGQLSMILGKCLSWETPIRLADGSSLDIKTLFENYNAGQELLIEAIDAVTHLPVARPVYSVVASGLKPTYRLVTEGGLSVRCSPEHLLLTNQGWKRLEELITPEENEGKVMKIISDAQVFTSIHPRAKATPEPIRAVSYEGRQECYDLAVEAPDTQRCVVAGGIVCHNSGTGKTTLIANMLWQFLRLQQLPSIFFSMEQPKAQVYITLTQVALGVPTKEAEDLIKSRDERLNEVDKLFELLTIVDNVPDEHSQPSPMTPSRITQLIHEINLTRGGEPVKVIAIDHLGMIKPGSDAPGSVRDNEMAASGHVMEEFYGICKQTNTFFMVLQQLPKEVPPGEEFGYDAGRGASQQTDFCDYIFCIWRPDQMKGISDDEKTALAGQYKFKLGKNRHGPNNIVAHLTFDHQKRRITTESAYGIPNAFLPPAAGAALDEMETGPPPDLFNDIPEEDLDNPPGWFVS